MFVNVTFEWKENYFFLSRGSSLMSRKKSKYLMVQSLYFALRLFTSVHLKPYRVISAVN